MKKIFIFSLVFLLLVLAVAVNNKISSSEEKEYFNYNGVNLSVGDYNLINENFQDFKQVKVCNLDSGDCIILTKTT
jgi:hypothetical protein